MPLSSVGSMPLGVMVRVPSTTTKVTLEKLVLVFLKLPGSSFIW